MFTFHLQPRPNLSLKLQTKGDNWELKSMDIPHTEHLQDEPFNPECNAHWHITSEFPDPLILRALELLNRIFIMNEYACKEEFRKWNKNLFRLEVQTSDNLLNKMEVFMSILSLVFLLCPVLILKKYLRVYACQTKCIIKDTKQNITKNIIQIFTLKSLAVSSTENLFEITFLSFKGIK